MSSAAAPLSSSSIVNQFQALFLESELVSLFKNLKNEKEKYDDSVGDIGSAQGHNFGREGRVGKYSRKRKDEKE